MIAAWGVIQQIGKGLPSADEELDLRGRLVVPPYVDPHLHLDYVYTGRSEGATNTSGTLFEGIARWRDVKKTQTSEDARERALDEFHLLAHRERLSAGPPGHLPEAAWSDPGEGSCGRAASTSASVRTLSMTRGIQSAMAA
jgi:dihydroorotase-like cyclic amidohydrolase